MQDRPNAIELLEAAADFVDREIVPATEGRVQFQSRVVANVMRIVAREIQFEDSFVRGEVNALAAMLGEPKPHIHSLDDLHKAAADLNEKLSARIRAGEVDSGPRRAEVIKIVRQAVEDKLRIANPRYLEADIAARKA
jgi:alcohol dehydrogenase class IV